MRKVVFDRDKNFGYITPSSSISYVRNMFKVKNPNPKASVYTKYFYPITPAGKFDIGLYSTIKERLSEFSDETEIVEEGDDYLEYVFPSLGNLSIKNIDGFKYYDYQKESIFNMFKFGRGIINLPTAAGKGLVMAGFSKSVLHKYDNSKILIVVPNIGLLKQLHNEFITDYGISDITKWSGKNVPDLSKSILISNSQILLSDLDKSISLLRDYDFLIVDECHKIKKTNTINKFIDGLNTPNRYGMTGTVPKEDIDKWNMFGKLGPVIISKKSSDLRTTVGSISDVEVRVLKLNHKKQPKRYKPKADEAFKPTGQYDNETEFIYGSNWRNSVIVNISNKLKGNILILVDRINHGEQLKEMFSSSRKEAHFIHGEMPVEERAIIQDRMESKDNIVCIAMSEIFSTGISIKNLKYCIFTCIGKAYTRILQSIGRTLRKHKNKEKSVIFDITDNTKYSSKHIDVRLEFYKEENINYEIQEIYESK